MEVRVVALKIDPTDEDPEADGAYYHRPNALDKESGDCRKGDRSSYSDEVHGPEFDACRSGREAEAGSRDPIAGFGLRWRWRDSGRTIGACSRRLIASR
jgi:hypothetical protein